jgi:PIN domain nuclease of toxin-antitoxin system
MKTDDPEAERYVLDSCALLAYLEDEVGGAPVEAVLAACERSEVEAWLSIVNFGEVVYITEREQGIHVAERVIASIDELPIRVSEADRDRTFAAGWWRRPTSATGTREAGDGGGGDRVRRPTLVPRGCDYGLVADQAEVSPISNPSAKQMGPSAGDPYGKYAPPV